MDKKAIGILIVGILLVGGFLYLGFQNDDQEQEVNNSTNQSSGVYQNLEYGFEITPTPLVITTDTAQVGWIPLCQGICFTYPHEEFSSIRFEAAAVSINVISPEEEMYSTSGCVLNESQEPKEVVINGEIFTKYIEGSGTGGHAQESVGYYTMHNGVCFGIHTGVDYATADIDDGKGGLVPQLTDAQIHEVQNILDNVVQTFKFTN